MMERTGEGVDPAKAHYIHFTAKRPIYLIIRNLHNGQLACFVRAERTYSWNDLRYTFENTGWRIKTSLTRQRQRRGIILRRFTADGWLKSGLGTVLAYSLCRIGVHEKLNYGLKILSNFEQGRFPRLLAEEELLLTPFSFALNYLLPFPKVSLFYHTLSPTYKYMYKKNYTNNSTVTLLWWR